MKRPFPAYEGTDPFIFVCYAHDDARQVYPEIVRLREAGFHVWYDEGISPGSEWSAQLAVRIQQCAVFLYFVTPRSVEREHCRAELNFALDQPCTILSVHLEPTNVPAALQLTLSHRQGILKYEHRLNAYEAKLDRALEGATSKPLINAKPGNSLPRRQSIKLPLLVAAVLVLLAGVGWRYWPMAEEFRLKGSTAGSVNACAELDLAVLPMQNLTGDVTENYLSRSISSELWSGLYRYQALKLVPMLASFGDVGTEGDLAQISEQLNARFVLDGSFRRYGNSLRLVVQLIDLRTTENLWARDYDLGSNTEAVFRASTDIVSEIAQALNLVTADNPQGPDTEHLAAWHLVERAWYRFIESGDINDVFPLLDRAIELDPQYARALSSKAVALTALAELGGLQAKEQLLSAKKLAQQAIELDSGDPTAIALTYNVLGSVYQRLELDFPKAYEAFLITQRFDLFSAADSFSDLLINAGRYKEGLEWASRHEAAFPADGSTRIQTARFLVRLGRIDEARDKIEEALKVSPGNQWVETVAVEFFVWDLNDQERSLQILNRGYVHSTVEQFARAELARQSGDPAVMVSLIDTWIERLREEYIPFHPWLISNGLYLIGDYERHIEWFSTRTDERSHVSWINDELNYRWPDYWSKLREWSLSDPSRVRERAIMIDAHRALVDRIQEKMTLHELTRESFGLGAELARCS